MIALIIPALMRVVNFAVSIPVWLIIGIVVGTGVWFHVDKSSAVHKAVTELVAGAELEAAEAKSAGLEKINAELQRRSDALSQSNARFAAAMKTAQTAQEAADAQLADLLSRPVNDACVVDSRIVEQLRSK